MVAARGSIRPLYWDEPNLMADILANDATRFDGHSLAQYLEGQKVRNDK